VVSAPWWKYGTAACGMPRPPNRQISKPRHYPRNPRQRAGRGLRTFASLADSRAALQWQARKEFDVIGSDTATRYRIKYGVEMNVYQLNPDGHPVAQWCLAPEVKLVIGDVLLAQKVALETMEREALAVANTQSYRPI